MLVDLDSWKFPDIVKTFPVLDVIPVYLNLRDAYAESKLRETYGIKAKWKTESAGHVRSRWLQKKKKCCMKTGCENTASLKRQSKLHASEDEQNLNTKILVLADVSANQLSGFQDLARSLSQRHATHIEVVIVEEDDVTQLQAGLACDRFVLSEITFHLWVALLRSG